MTADKIFRAIPDLCSGCLTCEMVCSLIKTGTINSAFARLRVKRSTVDGACDPIICRHCRIPLCFKACAVEGAMSRDAGTGVVVINGEKCNRCMACVRECPFDAMWTGPNDEILKCDLCGGSPMCVKYCPPRPDHHFPALPYPAASALEYVEPGNATRMDAPQASGGSQ